MDWSDLGLIVGPLGVVAGGLFYFIRWNRDEQLKDHEKRLTEVRELVKYQNDRIKTLEEAERKCNERVDQLVRDLSEARQMNARLEERIDNIRPPGQPGTDQHRPLKDRRKMDDPKYRGPKRRESDGPHDGGDQ